MNKRQFVVLALLSASMTTAGCAQLETPREAMTTVSPGVPVTGTDIPVSASIRTDARAVEAQPDCVNSVVIVNGAAVPRGCTTEPVAPRGR
jgi:hypothetical protein